MLKFSKNLFLKRFFFSVKENEASFGRFGNSLFVEMEPSKLINGQRDMVNLLFKYPIFLGDDSKETMKLAVGIIQGDFGSKNSCQVL
jgi:hypothetical protein